ncbi:MAG: hypothetical protein HC913_09600 [Microscillaceae bacterium]|nr:hypothetical protein [Microscillaceae bacterium]
MPSGFATSSLAGNYEYSLDNLWLEVPIGIHYLLLSKGKLDLAVNAGLSSFFYLREKYTKPEIVSQVFDPETGIMNGQTQNYFSENTSENGLLHRIEPFRAMYVGFSFSTLIHPRYRLSFVPHYQFSLAKMTQLKFNPHFLGLGFRLDFLKPVR